MKDILFWLWLFLAGYVMVDLWHELTHVSQRVDRCLERSETALEDCAKAKVEPVPCRSVLQVDREGNLFFRGYGGLAYGYDTEGVRFCPCPEPQTEDKP